MHDQTSIIQTSRLVQRFSSLRNSEVDEDKSLLTLRRRKLQNFINEQNSFSSVGGYQVEFSSWTGLKKRNSGSLSFSGNFDEFQLCMVGESQPKFIKIA